MSQQRESEALEALATQRGLMDILSARTRQLESRLSTLTAEHRDRLLTETQLRTSETSELRSERDSALSELRTLTSQLSDCRRDSLELIETLRSRDLEISRLKSELRDADDRNSRLLRTLRALTHKRVMISGFCEEETPLKSRLTTLARSLGAELVENFDEGVTHVLVPTPMRKTLKVLVAAARMIWLMPASWVESSVAANGWVSETSSGGMRHESPRLRGKRVWVSDGLRREAQDFGNLSKLVKATDAEFVDSADTADLLLVSPGETTADSSKTLTWGELQAWLLPWYSSPPVKK